MNAKLMGGSRKLFAITLCTSSTAWNLFTADNTLSGQAALIRDWQKL